MEAAEVTYYRGEETARLSPRGGAAGKELPAEYLLKEPGVYVWADSAWPVEKEGLYVFSAPEGQRWHCYYEKDVFALVAALCRSAEFSGDARYEKWGNIDARLASGPETHIPAISLLFICLDHLLTPARSILLYSPLIDNVISNWIEVWSDETRSWELYWPDRALYLGTVNKNRTCFDVFDALKKNELTGEFLRPRAPLCNEILQRQGILGEMEAALGDGAACAALMDKWRVFPLIRAEGTMVLKTVSLTKYEQELPDGLHTVHVGEDTDPLFKVECFSDEYIRENIYGKQAYIIRHRLVRTG